MAQRNLLATHLLDEFSDWLKAKGWTIVEPKGTWEKLRATKAGKTPIIIYFRYEDNNPSQVHLSVPERAIGIVRNFINWRKQKS